MNVRLCKILRDIWLNKSRSLLIIFAVAIGVAAFGLMLTGRIILEENLKAEYSASNPAQVTLTISPFDDDLLKIVQNFDDVDKAEAIRVDYARLLTSPDTWVNIEIHTLPETGSLNRITFEDVASSMQENSIYLERSLKNIAHVGDAVTIQLNNGDTYDLQVAGFVNDLSHLPSEITLSGLGYINLDTAAHLNFPDTYSQLLITFKNTSTRRQIEQKTTQLIEDLEDEGYQVFSAPIPTPGKYILNDSMTSVLFILNSMGILTLILSAFLVTSVMSAVMSQQIPQIGILKSIGGRISQTMALYFQEVLLFGLIAFILAVPMGLFGAYFLADGMASGMNFNIGSFYLPSLTVLLQAISAILAPVLASLVPIISGSRITIREAISNYNPQSGAVPFKSSGFSQLVNLSIRNTFRRQGRLILSLAALLLAGSMFIAILGIRQSMREAVHEIQGDLNYDVGIDLEKPYSIKKISDEAIKVDGVRAVEAWTMADARLVLGKDHLSGSISITGVPKDSKMATPGVIHGTWLMPNIARGLFVNADFMELSPDLKIGSVVTLNINGREVEWVILGSGGKGFTPAAYVHEDDLTGITNTNGQANRIVLQTDLDTTAFQAGVQTKILERFLNADLDVINSQTTTELKESNAAQMDILIILLMSMVVLIALVGGLGLAITMSLNVIERTREIGILRSLGAQNTTVRRVVVTEGVVIGLLSWLLAIPCSIPLALFLGNSLGISLLARPLDYIFSIPAVLLWLGLMLIISVVASIIPAQNAARITIRDALVYE